MYTSSQSDKNQYSDKDTAIVMIMAQSMSLPPPPSVCLADASDYCQVFSCCNQLNIVIIIIIIIIINIIIIIIIIGDKHPHQIVIIITRPYAALRTVGLHWIVEMGFRSGT